MYPMLSLNYIKKFIPYAQQNNVSEVARSKRGFLTAYMNGQLTEDWLHKRENFIKRHLAQYKRGEMRRRVAMIMWAFDPELASES